MKKFTYRSDRRTRYITAAMLLAMSSLGIGLMLFYDGGFFSTWYLTLILALLALAALSIPRSIVITDSSIEVRCLCNLIEIETSDIVSVRRVSRDELRLFPLMGIWGVFGYYGRYFDRRNMMTVQLYATRWDDFIEIVDSSDEYYYLSTHRADELLSAIRICLPDKPAA